MKVVRPVLFRWIIALLVSPMGVCLTFGASLAQSIPGFDTPYLTLDPGMHLDPIQKMAINQDESILATISLDKTVRIWSVSNLKVRKTIRIPMLPGEEGRLYAVAVSPSGGVVAVAGNTCNTWNSAYCIYLINTFNDKIPLKITGITEPVMDLDFSSDGEYLAAAVNNGAGLRVYRTSSGQQVARDTTPGSGATWVQFSEGGNNVVTLGNDDRIRLYDRNFVLQMARQLPKNLRARSASFSPDGQKLAVVFTGKPYISVFSAKDLELLYLPDVTKLSGPLGSVAWSSDGKSLYGAGNHMAHFKRIIRWWSNAGQPDSAGRGDFVELPVSTTPIQQILPLRSGGMLFTSASTAIGHLDAHGFLEATHKYPNVVFPKCRGFMKISPSGDTISFPMTPENTLTGYFSLNQLEFFIKKTTSNTLMVPKRRAESFKLQATLSEGDALLLRLNGSPLSGLESEDISCFAIARDERFFVASTSKALYLYDQAGALHWRMAVDSPVRALNIPENDKFVIATMFDGTVNWYNAASGKLELSLFVNAENGEWIAWTPAFYYVASSKGESYLGWHRNIALDQPATFIPVSQGKARFNKPEMIQNILN
ncbi:MAG: WD40 repeat domain-containing protein [Magnetococcales bacterium]|nr:WD40 repeat domain-containing protein [Magnetococcales bacterium]